MLNIIFHLYVLNGIYSKTKITARNLKTLLGDFIVDSNTGIRINQYPRFSLPEKKYKYEMKYPCNSKVTNIKMNSLKSF